MISGLFLTSIGSELPFSWLDFGSLVLEPDIVQVLTTACDLVLADLQLLHGFWMYRVST